MKLVSSLAVCLGLAGCLGQEGGDPAGPAAGPSGETAASVQVAVAGRVAFGSFDEAPPTMATVVRAAAEPLAAPAPEELGVVENVRAVFDPNAKSLVEFRMRGGVQR